jgi:hypothetical protein
MVDTVEFPKVDIMFRVNMLRDPATLIGEFTIYPGSPFFRHSVIGSITPSIKNVAED